MKKLFILTSLSISLFLGCKKNNDNSFRNQENATYINANSITTSNLNLDVISNSLVNIINSMDNLNATQVCHLKSIMSNSNQTHQEKFNSLLSDPILNTFAANALINSNNMINAGYNSNLTETEINEIILKSNDVLFGIVDVKCGKARAWVDKCNKDLQFCAVASGLAGAGTGGSGFLIGLIYCLYQFDGCVGSVAQSYPNCFTPGGSLVKTRNFFTDQFVLSPSTINCN